MSADSPYETLGVPTLVMRKKKTLVVRQKKPQVILR